jgi:hypothetical protein
MPTGRRGHACALVRNEKTGNHEIVAAGGFSTKYFATVEIYTVSSKSWRKAGMCQPVTMVSKPEQVL